MKLAIGCDHAGYEMKEKIKDFLYTKGDIEIYDFGTNSNQSVDYPEFGHAVAKKVISDNVKGIVVCGSGIGISIAANKVKGIRAALCTTAEHAEMSRKHNDSNVLALGARTTAYEEIKNIIDVWLSTQFEGGRHLDRINKIENV